ncbi:hypothetical protein CQW23_13248 [Capsicum baccatum]|uniref:Uncharacterized protein n=1 Tax=Capsicum baccatum TaxID=33114 RepID=A0A2G2WV33_CAPBA|nr:hypothetical protein CQW23_13248 [Capsicum baccatum]
MYLAAESGLRDALVEILNTCEQPTSSAGPLNRTRLHAAVIQEHKGLKEVVSDMLVWKRSLAFLPAGSDNDWTTAIHTAAGGGKVDVIHTLLNHCPDCREMLDSNGRNALHIAIFCSRANMVSYLLKPTKWDKLIEDPDNDGNTPLYLLASSIFGAMCLWN